MSAESQEELDPAAAELFRQGRDLIKKGDWKNGCEKLDASMKRYAAASTLLNLALCRQEEGRVATAWAMVQQALVLNRDTVGTQRRDRLQASGEEMLAKLEPRLSRLRVTVVPPTEGARVEEAGRSLPLDSAVPLDPGAHELVLSLPGRPDVKRQVSLREGETLSVELAVPQAAPDPMPEQKKDVERKATPTRETRPATGDGIPVWAWVVGGTGLGFAGVSVGFGVDAAIAAGNLEERCGEDLICNEDPSYDPEPENDRKNRGTALAIAFGIAGAGALVAGIVGVATADPSTSAQGVSLRVEPWLGPHTVGLGISGRL
ncbi:MAG: hypothetical protein JNK04_09095 [Myxococcales bacterium]|nr:hypothetical protein [Myxococcales bacterium]